MLVPRRSLFALPLVACARVEARDPRRRTPSRRSVVVIGAGLAGLAVAHDLRRANVDVLVLEARDVAGGRISTLRAPFGEGLYVDTGAIHVVPDRDLLALIASANVPLVDAKKRRDLAHAYVRGGQRSVVPAGASVPEAARFTDDEERLGFVGRLEHYLPEAKSDPTQPWPPPALAHLDRTSIAALLRARGASPAYVTEFGDAHVGESIEDVSAAFVIREIAALLREIRLEKRPGRIAGGSDRLPQRLAEMLGDAVVFGAAVRRLEAVPGGVTIGFLDKHRRLVSVEAEQVVCAIPYGVLRDVEIAQRLSPRKRAAIRDLPSVSVARAFVEVRERFWLERGESADVESDLAIGNLRDETQLLEGPRAGILGAYMSGDRARRFCSLDDEGRRLRLAQDAEAAMPGVLARAGAVVTKCWDDEPYTRGAYAYLRPGQMTAWGDALWAPEGRIHFAGDHVSYRPGFMHGAVASAKRVVREVLASSRLRG